MWISKLKLKNIGPISELNLIFPFNDKRLPKVLVLVGLNGSGKSLVLSYLADALIEFKRRFYEDLEVEKDRYFKVSSKTYVKAGADYGFCEVLFKEGNKEFFYSEVLTLVNYEDFKRKYSSQINLKGFNINDNKFKEIGMAKWFSQDQDLKKIIDSNVLLYFPWTRSESPAWLNREHLNISFILKPRFVTLYGRRIVQVESFNTLCTWILDVILDKYVYQNSRYEESLNRELNRVLDTILFYKKEDKNEFIRFGIGLRHYGTRVAVVKDKTNEEGEGIITPVAPTLFHLSSGEATLLSLFATILYDYDQLGRKEEFKLEDIEGIVLIDEADLHLHIDLQYYVFPKIVKLFPRIQFIITTHSPFLIAGLNREISENLEVIHLPEGSLIEPDEFSEFEKAYKIFYQEGIKYKEELKRLKQTLVDIEKPLIITEGKTDWMLLKKAKEKLAIGLEVAFYETAEDLGKDRLKRMVEDFSKISIPKPIIFIFDRDDPNILKKMTEENKSYKKWGNNVFSLVLPIPSHRSNYQNITIEMYFKDEEITRRTKDGKRLFFDNEIEKVIDPQTNQVICYRPVEPRKDKEFSKKVFSENVEMIKDNSGRPVGISKTRFAELVVSEEEPFNNVDFSEFKKVFEIIENILRDCKLWNK